MRLHLLRRPRARVVVAVTFLPCQNGKLTSLSLPRVCAACAVHLNHVIHRLRECRTLQCCSWIKHVRRRPQFLPRSVNVYTQCTVGNSLHNYWCKLSSNVISSVHPNDMLSGLLGLVLVFVSLRLCELSFDDSMVDYLSAEILLQQAFLIRASVSENPQQKWSCCSICSRRTMHGLSGWYFCCVPRALCEE